MSKKASNFVGGIFNNPEDAQAVVEEMIKQGFPMDQVSILHKAGGKGDDFLGIVYTDEKERFQVWGAGGALAGALGGLLAGAGGLMLIPGIGPVLVAGPIINAVVGAVAGAGIMTAGAAATHLTIALRRMGIPEEKLEMLHQAVMDGKTVVLMNVGKDDPEAWRSRLEWKGADPVLVLP